MLWIHKGYCVVKNWCEMFVLQLSGIQNPLNNLMVYFYVNLIFLLLYIICIIYIYNILWVRSKVFYPRVNCWGFPYRNNCCLRIFLHPLLNNYRFLAINCMKIKCNKHFLLRCTFVYLKSLKRTFKTGFWVKNHLLNLCSSAMNS